MTGASLLAALACRGAHLHLDGDALRFCAPRGAVTEELRAAVADLRPLLIAAFRAQTGQLPESLDPRRDRVEYAEPWDSLLRAAYRIDAGDPNGVYGLLLGMRCWGATLSPGPDGVRMSRGEMSEEEYGALRRELAPHAERIRALFAVVGARSEGAM